jgi:hypothetical protein
MIAPISEQKIQSIRNNSVRNLPDEPSKVGYTATQLKELFVAPVTSATNSALSEINRVIREANVEITNIVATITTGQETLTTADATLQGNIDSEAEARGTADATLQGNIDTTSINLENETTTRQDEINAINELIPSQATSNNKLADKDFVNSSIAGTSANPRGNFPSLAGLNSNVWENLPSMNDYATVDLIENDINQTNYPQGAKTGEVWRYKYTGSSWIPDFKVNDTPFTQSQADAINSGMSSADKTKLDGVEAYANNYELPKATNSALGGIRTGHFSNTIYELPVLLDDLDTAYVIEPPKLITYNATTLALLNTRFNSLTEAQKINAVIYVKSDTTFNYVSNCKVNISFLPPLTTQTDPVNVSSIKLPKGLVLKPATGQYGDINTLLNTIWIGHAMDGSNTDLPMILGDGNTVIYKVRFPVSSTRGLMGKLAMGVDVENLGIAVVDYANNKQVLSIDTINFDLIYPAV